MTIYEARGLTADWLNAWLAAIGITVLVPDTRLAWSDGPSPYALFSIRDGRVLDALAEAFPSEDELALLANDLPQKAKLTAFRNVAMLARSTHDHSVVAFASDLKRDLRDDEVKRGPFDPGVPAGRSVRFRLMKCRKDLPSARDELRSRLEMTLSGTAVRTPGNGLGFDYRRIAAGVQREADKHVDAAVELLAFYGLALFPVRGNGFRIAQRGWVDDADKRGAFTWPTWEHSLDRWAVDAALDIWYSKHQRKALWGLNAGYQSVPFRKTATKDPTRGFASEPFP